MLANSNTDAAAISATTDSCQTQSPPPTNSKTKSKTRKNPSLNRNQINANWNTFMSTFEPKPPKKCKFPTTASTTQTKPNDSQRFAKNMSHHHQTTIKNKNTANNNNNIIGKPTSHIAMDCEMVGVGYQGKKHMLARVSIVNQSGHILYDNYVKPTEPVIDYRTPISGIRPEHLEEAKEFSLVQREVADLMHNRILIGHGIHNDLKVLFLKHPKYKIRDTSKYKPLKCITGGTTPSLKILCVCILGYDIQTSEHNSIEDAWATMQIYNKCSRNWENMLRYQSKEL